MGRGRTKNKKKREGGEQEREWSERSGNEVDVLSTSTWDLSRNVITLDTVASALEGQRRLQDGVTRVASVEPLRNGGIFFPVSSCVFSFSDIIQCSSYWFFFSCLLSFFFSFLFLVSSHVLM